MPPKELPVNIKGPGDILKYLKEDDMHYLGIFLANLSDDTKEKVLTLFRLLDKNNDNQLNRTDFTYPHPNVDKVLGYIWKLLSLECSVYGNESISLDEFTKGLICSFILYVCIQM